MMTLIISPHADDETLGPGGTLLKRKKQGGETAWLNITTPGEAIGWSQDMVAKRRELLHSVTEKYEFDHFEQLAYPAAQLTNSTTPDLVRDISNRIRDLAPSEILVPHWSDAHSDHRIIFEASWAASKWFRATSITKILCYETISETNFSSPISTNFRANHYEDISEELEIKVKIASMYDTELGNHPFPRSLEILENLASMRGSESGFNYAEAFQMVMSRNR